MSGKLKQDTKVNLDCTACRQVLQKPRILPCLHSVCSKCLQAILDSNKTKDKFSCVKCDAKIPIPISGLDGFHENVFLNGEIGVHTAHDSNGKVCDICSLRKKKNPASSKCLDCGDLLCQNCSVSHSATRLTINHRIADLENVIKGNHDKEIRSLNKIPCPSHPEEVLSVFCHDCMCLACHECQLTYHFNHDTAALDDAHTAQRREIATSIQFLDSKVQHLNEIEDGIRTTNATIHEKEQEILLELEDSSKQLIAQIETEKSDIIQKVKHHMSRQREICQEHEQQVLQRKDKIKDSCEFCNEVVQSGKNDEVVFLEPVLTNRLSKLENLPKLREDITCHFPEVRLRNIFGKVESIRFFDFLPGPASSIQLLPKEETDVSGAPKISQLQIVRKINTFTNDDETCPKISGITSGEQGYFFIGDNGNLKIKKFNSNGKYIETLTRSKSYSICVADDTIVRSDNFSVVFSSPDYNRKVGMNGTSSAYPICIYENANLAIADSSSHEIFIFDKTGEIVSSITIPRTSRRTRRRNIMFLSANSAGEIIASDWGTNAVIMISKDGKIAREFTCKSDGSRDWVPGGVCVDIHDNIFIADQQKGSIIILNPRLKVILKHSTKRDYLERPMHIAYDSSGQVLVSGKNGIVNIYSCKYF